MNKEREIAGIKVFVSNETYNEYKGTLQGQINELQERIDKALEYIEERFEYVLKDENFLDHDDLVEKRIALHLLNILQGKEK